MKAAVLYGPSLVRCQTVPDPVLESHSVIVKVKVCGICGSDLHIFKGGGRDGLILGHEFSGEVVDIGAEVHDIKMGERVIAVSYRPCLTCYWCKQGQYHRCSNMAIGGEKIPGALAEYVAVPYAQLGRNVFKMSDKLTFEEGTLVEPVSVGYFAAVRAQAKPEDTVVVIGAGTIGLGTIQILRAMGITNIIASGNRPRRLELAKYSGAKYVIDAANEDPLSAVKQATSGSGADIVFECAGVPNSFAQAVEMVRGRGKIMLVALYDASFLWNPRMTIEKNLYILGCFGGNMPKTLEYLEAGKINPEPFITHQIPIDRVQEAFIATKLPDAIKVIVRMESTE